MKHVTYTNSDHAPMISLSASSELDLYKFGINATAHILQPDAASDPIVDRIKRSVVIRSIDPARRLQDFIKQVLSFSYEDHAVFNELAIEILSKGDMRAIVYGRKVSGYRKRIYTNSLSVQNFERSGKKTWSAKIKYECLSD